MASYTSTNNSASSTFQRQRNICLYNWWLIRAQNDINGKTLAVGGLKYEGQKGTRIFSSAPIVKRHDFATFQTADGVTMSIKGCINETRSNENGVPSEVYNHFRLGFPYNWDASLYHCGEGSAISTSNVCLSNDQVNLKDGGSKENSFMEKLEDASKDPVLQVNAVLLLGHSDVELQTTEDSQTRNEVGETVVVSCTSSGQMNSTKESMGPFEARRSSRLKNMKRGTENKQETVETKAILVSLNSDWVTVDELDCESRGIDVGDGPSIGPHEKMNCLSDVNLIGIKGKIVLASPNDGPTVSVRYPNCDDDNHLLKLGSDVNNVNSSEINMSAPMETPNYCLESLSKKDTSENPADHSSRRYSKAVTSCHKMDINKKSTGPLEARRSSRLNIMKKSSNDRQKICRSYERLDATDDMKMYAGKQDNHDIKLRISQSKTKRRLEYITDVSSPPISRNRRKILCFLSPEESSCKRSSSGRFVVPPLDYWRNQKILYDRDRRVAGVLNGLPFAESRTGSESEPLRKKQKFI